MDSSNDSYYGKWACPRTQTCSLSSVTLVIVFDINCIFILYLVKKWLFIYLYNIAYLYIHYAEM